MVAANAHGVSGSLLVLELPAFRVQRLPQTGRQVGAQGRSGSSQVDASGGLPVRHESLHKLQQMRREQEWVELAGK
eukprot:scaffold7339_cov249-Pinguiococcus_pyrenoidosus.AAC.5